MSGVQMVTPSNKLVGLVLKTDISSIDKVTVDNTNFRIQKINGITEVHNIDKFSILCKHRMNEFGYSLFSAVSPSGLLGLCLYDTHETPLMDYEHLTKGETEAEAIILACEKIIG